MTTHDTRRKSSVCGPRYAAPWALPLYGAVLLGAAVGLPVHAAHADVYVSSASNASDDNPGTADQPIRHIRTGALRAQNIGDTVVRVVGYYLMDRQEIIDISGITIEGDGNGVTIDGNGVSINDYGGSLIELQADNDTFTNLTVINSSIGGIRITQHSYCTISNCSVNNCGENGISVDGQADDGSDALGDHVTGCTVTNTNRDHIGQSGGGTGSGIAIEKTSGTQVDNCTSDYNYGEGLQAKQTAFVKLYSNHVHDNYSINIYLDNDHEFDVAGNDCYNDDNPAFFKDNRAAANITIANETYSTGYHETLGGQIHDNTTNSGWRGFWYGNYDAGGGFQNVRIYNNHFLNADLNSVYFDTSYGNTPSFSGSSFDNNEVSGGYGPNFSDTDSFGLEHSGNYYTGGSSAD